MATAHLCTDQQALADLIVETEADPIGLVGVILGLLEYVDYVNGHTGLLPDAPPGDQDQA